MPLFVGIGWLWGYLCCVLHLATARRKWTKSWIVSIPTRFGILRQDKKSQKSTYLSGTICTIPVRRFATILLAMVVCCLARAMHFYYKITSFRQNHHEPCSETDALRSAHGSGEGTSSKLSPRLHGTFTYTQKHAAWGLQIHLQTGGAIDLRVAGCTNCTVFMHKIF